MSDVDQQRLSEYTAGTSTQTVRRTISFGLETSQTKNNKVATGIEEFQQMTAFMADMMPSYPEFAWTPQNTTMYRQVTREFPTEDRAVKATIAREAQQKVAEAYRSWASRGKEGNRPQFGDGQYLRLSHQDLELAKNDRGWGLKASFIPYNPVWFHIRDGAFQRRLLERVTDEDDDARAGAAELYLDDDGALTCNLVVRWDVEVYEPSDVNTVVGVDLNDDPLVAAAVISTNEDDEVDVHGVEMESGAEYRHYREQLKRKRSEVMEEDNLSAIKDARLNYHRYTDHITNVASRRVVDLAVDHTPAKIHLEDLTHYRETAKEPIHDWPFAEIQDKVAYKATEEGIPVEFIDPRATSTTCRKCGTTSLESRDGREFVCVKCGYEVHADVNAAINIAKKSP